MDRQVASLQIGEEGIEERGALASANETPVRSRGSTPEPEAEQEQEQEQEQEAEEAEDGPVTGRAEAAPGERTAEERDTDELARFRREWENEVRRRRGAGGDGQGSSSSSGGSKGWSSTEYRRAARRFGRQTASADEALKEEEEEAQQADEEQGLSEDERPHSPSTIQETLQKNGASDRAQAQASLSSQHRRYRQAGQQKLNSSLAASRRQAALDAQNDALKQAADGGGDEHDNDAADAADGKEGAGESTMPKNAPIRLMRSSVEAYARAVENERRGKLDDALLFYRRAFRLDSNADRLYQRAATLISASLDGESPSDAKRRGTAKDQLIATPEVVERVKAALDIDDYRYKAIMKRKELEQAEAGEKVQQAHARTEEDAVLEGEPGDDAESAAAAVGTDHLSRLIYRLSIGGGGERDFSLVKFEPADEEQPEQLQINKLPDEVLLHIISLVAQPNGRRGAKIVRPGEATAPRHASNETEEAPSDAQAKAATADVDHRRQRGPPGVGIVLAGPDYISVEQLARVCWKFRLLTRSWGVWRSIVRETYYPPQIPAKVKLAQLVQEHDDDWRTTFVEQPRLRLNGAYIASYHYTRPGMHEDNVWIRVVHVVEFYRTLRFLPDGRTLSLLTTDAPSETVRKMEPSLKSKGFAIGRWSLHPKGLDDDAEAGRPPGPKVVVEDLKDRTMQRYSFRIVLRLTRTRRGLWNRLEILEYESLNLVSGETLPLPQTHQKPFHFSPVRSYGI
ncbi:hypothetical protein FA10DRAFT_268629 [Acaromyces ingoldii]|uniref:F-box protein Hrt3/FBXO9 C-terminal domain-containing protein n=1 Tax=Acaromyces ingoldii TaxID=215250 RepID=A0A316YG97_9BASI|nr:hypothetical protein FA10DRAFT_268629 [Acaromyces ingoldii]PWN88437.1 hypothetical protein FA10DRAFT_268629 [Acaromyces ingoldii]